MAATTTSDRRQLVLVFSAWKLLLFTLTAFCPGPGYDTSGLILIDPSVDRHINAKSSSTFQHVILNLFRWDALYFIKAAERGLVFEQEWAFSPAFSRLLGIARRFIASNAGGPISYHIVAGIVVSTICHLLSVLALYRLLTLLTGAGRHQSRIPFVASVLHTLTPASLFLSAPYTESMFSMLNLAGMLCYVESKVAANSSSVGTKEIAYRFSSGLLIAFATTVRSNGLLSGLILLYDVTRYLPRLLCLQSNVHDVCRVVVTCASGAMIAIGFVGPQYLAYIEFCNNRDSAIRPWCERSIPSIYSWVQSHYWNVGLFRYWTLSNLPLFLLAIPMLWLLVYSSITTIRIAYAQPLHGRPVPHTSNTFDTKLMAPVVCDLPELALPQLLLALAAASSFHVQIINRIASGYPVWYLTVATWLIDSDADPRHRSEARKGQLTVRAMIMYSMIQGMLFANFLPPA